MLVLKLLLKRPTLTEKPRRDAKPTSRPEPPKLPFLEYEIIKGGNQKEDRNEEEETKCGKTRNRWVERKYKGNKNIPRNIIKLCEVGGKKKKKKENKGVVKEEDEEKREA